MKTNRSSLSCGSRKVRKWGSGVGAGCGGWIRVSGGSGAGVSGRGVDESWGEGGGVSSGDGGTGSAGTSLTEEEDSCSAGTTGKGSTRSASAAPNARVASRNPPVSRREECCIDCEVV